MDNKVSSYRIFNWVAVGILAYIALFPLISPFLVALSPEVFRCYYLAATGKPCPFCYMTRDFQELLHGRFHYLNTLTPYAALFIFAEAVFRAIVLIRFQKIKALRALIIADIASHSVLFAVIFGYMAWFFATH